MQIVEDGASDRADEVDLAAGWVGDARRARPGRGRCAGRWGSRPGRGRCRAGIPPRSPWRGADPATPCTTALARPCLERRPASSTPSRTPIPGNRPSARTKYTPTRDGNARSRCSVARVCSSTTSTSSNGTCRGQLTQVTGLEPARRHSDRPDHRRHRRTQSPATGGASGPGKGGQNRPLRLLGRN